MAPSPRKSPKGKKQNTNSKKQSPRSNKEDPGKGKPEQMCNVCHRPATPSNVRQCKKCDNVVHDKCLHNTSIDHYLVLQLNHDGTELLLCCDCHAKERNIDPNSKEYADTVKRYLDECQEQGKNPRVGYSMKSYGDGLTTKAPAGKRKPPQQQSKRARSPSPAPAPAKRATRSTLAAVPVALKSKPKFEVGEQVDGLFRKGKGNQGWFSGKVRAVTAGKDGYPRYEVCYDDNDVDKDLEEKHLRNTKRKQAPSKKAAAQGKPAAKRRNPVGKSSDKVRFT